MPNDCLIRVPHRHRDDYFMNGRPVPKEIAEGVLNDLPSSHTALRTAGILRNVAIGLVLGGVGMTMAGVLLDSGHSSHSREIAGTALLVSGPTLMVTGLSLSITGRSFYDTAIERSCSLQLSRDDPHSLSIVFAQAQCAIRLQIFGDPTQLFYAS